MPKIDVVHSSVVSNSDQKKPLAENAGPKFNIHKKIIRTAQEDAFFKTGVDVVETEEYEFEGSAADAANAFKAGVLTAEQIKQLLQSKLKDDKIFGFESFEEFNKQYFKKELVAFDDFHKVRQLKYARTKYNNRLAQKPVYNPYGGHLARAGAGIA